ncbi:MAG: substrate-binding domain-containing protein, partial [Succinivibrio sp.]
VILHKIQGYDEAAHLKASDELRNKGCLALCLATVDTKAVADKIKECQSLGIKVILVNSDVSDCDRICYVGSDYVKAGRTCAGLLSLIAREDKLNILVVTGSHLMQGHRKRIEGFEEELKALKVNYNIQAQIESDDSDIKAQIKTSEYLNMHKDINCVYVTGAGVQGVGAAIIATGRRDIIGIAFDDIYTNIEMVRAGIFKFVICQQPDRQGYHSVKRAYQLLSGTVNEQSMGDFYTDTIIKIASNIGR